MDEYDLIRTIAGTFPRHRAQRNAVFTCDAEVLDLGGQLWALTLDEFTPEEDLFTADDPERLGANLAVATLSDLLAAGATPEFFLQALSLPRGVESGFVDGLTRGLRTVLEAAGCALCGGDLGVAATWRFSGFAMGRIPAGQQPLTRLLPDAPQVLWVTGVLGDANLAALRGQPTPRFELRTEVARRVRQHGTACIDTSGGFLDAVWLLHALNPGLRFEIDCRAVPLAPGLEEFAATAGMPAEAALLGGAGEYELLFAVPAGLAESAAAALAALGASPVGVCMPSPESELWLVRRDGTRVAMSAPPPCPRAAASVAEHVQEVVRQAHQLFGAEGRVVVA